MPLHGGADIAAMSHIHTAMPPPASLASSSSPMSSSYSPPCTTQAILPPRTFYQRSHSFEARCRMAAQMRAQYVGYVPIVFESVAQCHSVRSHSSAASTSRSAQGEQSASTHDICTGPTQPFSSPASSNALNTNTADHNNDSNASNGDTAYLRQAAAKATQLWQHWRTSLTSTTELYDHNATTTSSSCSNEVGRGNEDEHLTGSKEPTARTHAGPSLPGVGRRREGKAERTRVVHEDRRSPLRPQEQGAIKFIMPRSKTLSEVILTLRERLTLDPYQAVFLSVGDNDVLAPGSSRLGELYDRFHNPDGFLYISYALENTFG